MNEKYILYVKKKCCFCVKAVSLLEEKQRQYSIIALGDNQKLLNEVKFANQWPTFPIIFIQDPDDAHSFRLIGGYTDLFEHFEAMDGW